MEELGEKVDNLTTSSSHSVDPSYDSEGLKFQTDIARLKSQVSNIAHRYDSGKFIIWQMVGSPAHISLGPSYDILLMAENGDR